LQGAQPAPDGGDRRDASIDGQTRVGHERAARNLSNSGSRRSMPCILGERENVRITRIV